MKTVTVRIPVAVWGELVVTGPTTTEMDDHKKRHELEFFSKETLEIGQVPDLLQWVECEVKVWECGVIPGKITAEVPIPEPVEVEGRVG